ncbi:MAG: GDP-mannose 4,6-dehydratase [Candidatus Firestonebacteria bacterium]
MKKCLVTGVAGFIGSHLAEKLISCGYDVIGIDNFTDYYSRFIKERNLNKLLKHSNFKFIKANLLTFKLNANIKSVDYVFHLAAQPGVMASWGANFKTYTENNVLVTQILLEQFKSSKKLKKFVYASSSSVYGDVQRLPAKEDSTLAPVSPYGVTKLAGEHLCYLYWRNFNLPVISLRYFSVYGPRQRPDMAIYKFAKAILTGDTVKIYGNGAQTRDFTYVSDVVNATVSASGSKVNGEVFNVGGGVRISVKNLIKKIEKMCNKKAKIEYIQFCKGDVKDTLADISKAKRHLDYLPKFSLDQGLENEINWLKEAII